MPLLKEGYRTSIDNGCQCVLSTQCCVLGRADQAPKDTPGTEGPRSDGGNLWTNLRPLKLASLIGTRVRTVRYLRKHYFRVAQVQGWYPRVGTSRNVVPYVPHQPHPSASSAQSLLSAIVAKQGLS